MQGIRYSFAAGGVTNKHTRVEEVGSLEDLYRKYRDPRTLHTTAQQYAQGGKAFRAKVKHRLGYFVGGELDGDRHDKNVTSRTLLTLDIERKPNQSTEPPPPREVVNTLRAVGVQAWVYTSLSHTRESPRYRVVVPLREPVHTAEELKHATLSAAERIGIDEWCTSESYVLSQPMFLPARLKNGVHQQWWVPGKPFRATVGSTKKEPAPIPDKVDTADPVVAALHAAGLYLTKDEETPGRHYFTCPWHAQHTTSNETQTVYFEANYNGYNQWGCKCLGTSPDVDGRPHMTRATLTRWLVEHGHLASGDEVGELDEYAAFDDKVSLQNLVRNPPPPQEWAVHNFAPIGAVTLLAAPGGQGKSMLVIHLAAHMALGMDWSVFKADGAMRTLYVTYEDGLRQVYDRIQDIREYMRPHEVLYDVDAGLNHGLLVHQVSDPGTWLFLTKPDRFTPAERTARVDWLIGYLRHAGIKLVVFDPMVYTHQLQENDIADMALYMHTLNFIAKQAECAVMVIHHMSKMGKGETLAEIDAHSLRGASSITDNARSAAVFVGMPFKDAAAYGVSEDEARGFAMFKHVKSNYGPLLDTCVFERRGRVLAPRPDVRKLDVAEARIVRDQAADRAKEQKMELYALQALEVLVEHTGSVSQNQVAMGVQPRWSPQRAKAVLAWCEEHELTESVWEGAGRSSQHTVTRAGRAWLRAKRKGG